jgi:hypothetical protein
VISTVLLGTIGAEPSTPEERALVAAESRELEQQPFGEEPQERRAELYRWWKEVPGISLEWCEPLLLDAKHDNEALQATLVLQAILSAGAFLLENPGRAWERRAIWAAGVEGALRTYRRAVAEAPSLRSVFLEELVKLEEAGRLAEYVDRHAPACD